MPDCPICGRPVDEAQERCTHCGAKQKMILPPPEALVPAPEEGLSPAAPREPEAQTAPKELRGKKKRVPRGVLAVVGLILLGLAICFFALHSTRHRTAEETVSAFLDALERQDAQALLKVVSTEDDSFQMTEESVTPFMEIYQNAGELSNLKEKFLAGTTLNRVQLTQMGDDYVMMVSPIEATIVVELDNPEVSSMGVSIVGEGDTCSVTVAGTEYPLDVENPVLTLTVLPGKYHIMACYSNHIMHYDIGRGTSSGFMVDGASVTLPLYENYSVVMAVVQDGVTVDSVMLDDASTGDDTEPYAYTGNINTSYQSMAIGPLSSDRKVIFTYSADGMEYTKSCTTGESGSVQTIGLYPTLTEEQKQEALEAAAQSILALYDAASVGDVDAINAMFDYGVMNETPYIGDVCLVSTLMEELENAENLNSGNIYQVLSLMGDMDFWMDISFPNGEVWGGYGSTLMGVMVRSSSVISEDGASGFVTSYEYNTYWVELSYYQNRWVIDRLTEADEEELGNPVVLFEESYPSET